MFAESYIDAFNAGAKDEKPCETCGACLQRCPVMKMSKEESQDEMTRLLHGEKTNRVLNECTFCFNCNHYCPRGLRPYALIMQRLADAMRNNGKGVPPYIEYLFTAKHDSSVFGDVYDSESEVEQQILDKWEMVPAESKEVLFIGCTGRKICKLGGVELMVTAFFQIAVITRNQFAI